MPYYFTRSKTASLRFSRPGLMSYILVLAFVSMLFASQAYAQASQHTIAANAGSNGSISPTGSVNVSSGANQSYTITANANYHIADVVVDSVHLGPQTSPYTYTFNNVTAAHSISTIFGRVVAVSTLSQLYSAFSNQQAGDEIIISPGTYNLNTNYGLILTVNNLFVHGSTGNRNDIVILGDAMSSSATVKQIFGLSSGAYAQYTTIQDLTCGQVAWSAIMFNGDESGDYSKVVNVRMINCYEQFLKGNVITTGTTGVTIERCLFEFTAANHLAPNYYTGAIDIHAAVNCVIQDNTISYIQSPGGSLPDPAIHLWDANVPCQNNIVQRNLIIDCDRGIGIWQPSGSPTNGGIIRNNMIYNSGTGVFADAPIYIEYAPDTQIYNNTVYSLASYPNAIEYRYSTTAGVLIENNLANKAITARDSATAIESNNVTDAQSSWFVSTSTPDLHLAYAVPSVVGKAFPYPD